MNIRVPWPPIRRRIRWGRKSRFSTRPAIPRRRIDSFFDRWLLPLIFGILGVVLASIGYGMIIVRIRRLMAACPCRCPPNRWRRRHPPATARRTIDFLVQATGSSEKSNTTATARSAGNGRRGRCRATVNASRRTSAKSNPK